MRKVLLVVSAVVFGTYFSTPVMASDVASGPGVGSGDQVLVAAKGKRRHVTRAKKPGLEDTVRRIVEDALRDKSTGEWNYLAKRMRPPKGTKWQGKWNTLGTKGWELVGQNENVYIFKRPAHFASRDEAAPAKVKASKPARSSSDHHARPKKSSSEGTVTPSSGGSSKPRGRYTR